MDECLCSGHSRAQREDTEQEVSQTTTEHCESCSLDKETSNLFLSPPPLSSHNYPCSLFLPLQDGGEECDSVPLGHLAPPWLPDSAVSMCQLCSVQFTVTRRRHHCRACGQVSEETCAVHVHVDWVIYTYYSQSMRWTMLIHNDCSLELKIVFIMYM